MTFDPRPPLRVCDACARHVFATETSCPFCAALLAPVRARPRFKMAPQLSRAQRFALAGAFAGLVGCSDSQAPAQDVPLYGAPIPNIGGTNGAGGRPVGSGGATAPGWADTGGTGAGGIGGSGDGGGFAPAYGVPPVVNDMDGGDSTGDDGGSDEDARHQ
jgi:hypothetical protein